MNKYLRADENTVSREVAKKPFTVQTSADEELRNRVRRAVKNTAVPADLESKILNFIRKKGQV